ncbi:hypothetical protein Tco_1419172 [Tanacetum coccineum]
MPTRGQAKLLKSRGKGSEWKEDSNLWKSTFGCLDYLSKKREVSGRSAAMAMLNTVRAHKEKFEHILRQDEAQRGIELVTRQQLPNKAVNTRTNKRATSLLSQLSDDLAAATSTSASWPLNFLTSSDDASQRECKSLFFDPEHASLAEPSHAAPPKWKFQSEAQKDNPLYA